MNNDAYALSLPVALLPHYPTDALQLVTRDKAAPNEQLDAFVSSGDYFMTLITALDSIIAELPKREAAVRAALENVVSDLEYVERTYVMTKKQT